MFTVRSKLFAWASATLQEENYVVSASKLDMSALSKVLEPGLPSDGPTLQRLLKVLPIPLILIS